MVFSVSLSDFSSEIFTAVCLYNILNMCFYFIYYIVLKRKFIVDQSLSHHFGRFQEFRVESK